MLHNAFFWKLDLCNTNNIEPYTFLMLFSRKSDPPPPTPIYVIVTDGGVCVPSGRRFDLCILVLIRATTDRHQRSVINNVYSLDMTTQLIRQEQPSTVTVHPALTQQTLTQHTCWSPSTARMPGHRVLRPLLHWQATIRLTSNYTNSHN